MNMFDSIKNAIVKSFHDKLAQSLFISFAVIFGLVKSLAHFIYDKDEININLWSSFGYALICYIILNLSYVIIKRDYNIKEVVIKSPQKLWWTFFSVLLFSYVLCWFTYWPGTVFIDNWYISRSGLNISVQHPIFYCALIQIFVKIGKALGGVHYSLIFYTGLQVLVVSSVLSTLLFYIFQKRIPKFLKYLSLLCFVVFPLYAMYSIYNVKDVYWSMCLLMVTVFIYQFVTNNPIIKNKSFYINFTLSLIGLILLRNNGIYIVVPCVLLLLLLHTSYRKHLCIVLAMCVATQILCAFSMKMINKKPLFQEKIGAPIQQVAAVVKNNGVMTEKQKEFINQLMPLENIKEHYTPYSVNGIKWTGRRFGFNHIFLQNNSREFLKIWWQMLPNNFGIYVKAFLQETYWFWAPVQKYPVDVGFQTLPTQKHDLHQWALENGYKKTHVISGKPQTILKSYYYYSKYFFREGILFWIILGCALLHYLKCRKRRYILIYLPSVLLWTTIIIAAPISQSFRYILPFAYLLPYFICLLFVKNDDCDISAPLNILNYAKWNSKTKRRFTIFIKTVSIVVFLGFFYLYSVSHIPLKARVDFFTKYTDEPSFYVRLNGYGMPLKEASWMTKNDKRGVVVQENNNHLELTVTASEDTNIVISLRGPDERDENGKRYEKWVKYTLFKINGESVMLGNQNVWHDKPYRYVLSAKKNMAYKIELKWRKK